MAQLSHILAISPSSNVRVWRLQMTGFIKLLCHSGARHLLLITNNAARVYRGSLLMAILSPFSLFHLPPPLSGQQWRFLTHRVKETTMPSSWNRLPHRNIVRRSSDAITSPSSTDSVTASSTATSSPTPVSSSSLSSSVSETETSSVSFRSLTGATDSEQNSATPNSELPLSSSPSLPITASTPTSIPPSSSPSFPATIANAGSRPPSISTVPTASVVSVQSHSSFSTLPALPSSSGSSAAQNTVLPSELFRASTSVAPIPAPTSDGIPQPDGTFTDSPSPLPLPSSMPGSRQTGMNTVQSASSSTQKNTIIGITSTFGGLIIVTAALLFLLRLVSRRKRAMAAHASTDHHRRLSADSWIGTRLGDSRAPTPATPSTYGIEGEGRNVESMQQVHPVVLSGYGRDDVNPGLSRPASSIMNDRDSINFYTPPGSSTALIFPESQSSSSVYLERSSPDFPTIPVIRITEAGSEYGSAPSASPFVDLEFSPSPSPSRTAANHFSDVSDRASQRDSASWVPLETPTDITNNPFLESLGTSHSQGAGLRDIPSYAKNPFLRMTTQRDSTSSYALSYAGPEDSSDDNILGGGSVQNPSTPTRLSRVTVASFKADVVHPISPADDIDRFFDLSLGKNSKKSTRTPSHFVNGSDNTPFDLVSPGPMSRSVSHVWE
ncbi:hypothetical protein BDW22DRAFT_645899 [Trametopsis cervina]|nr:hypothetical protein BDW22DRAFT_645899 [Trametopsis cervina]